MGQLPRTAAAVRPRPAPTRQVECGVDRKAENWRALGEPRCLLRIPGGPFLSPSFLFPNFDIKTFNYKEEWKLSFDSIEGQLQVTDTVELDPFPKNEGSRFCFYFFIFLL